MIYNTLTSSKMQGGMIGGIFGSSPFNVIGPAGALTGQLSLYSAQWGPEILPWIAIVSGLMCTVVLKCGLHKYMLFMPKSVFEVLSFLFPISDFNAQIPSQGKHMC